MGNGNTGIVHRNTSLLAIEMSLPQVTVTSDEIDEMLKHKEAELLEV